MASNIKLKNNINSEFTVTHEDNQGAISVSSTDLAKVVSVDTIADLRATAKTQPTVWVSGYHTKGDGAFGSNIFEWDATSTEDDNGGTIIKLDSVATGRYKLRYSNSVNVKWFGAKGDGVTDDTLAIQSCFNLGVSLYISKGTYRCNSELVITNRNTSISMEIGNDNDSTTSIASYASTGFGIRFSVNDGDLDGCYWQNVRVTQNGTGSGAVDIGQLSYATFINCSFSTGGKIGQEALRVRGDDNGSGAYYNTFIGCTFSCTGTAFQSTGSYAVRLFETALGATPNSNTFVSCRMSGGAVGLRISGNNNCFYSPYLESNSIVAVQFVASLNNTRCLDNIVTNPRVEGSLTTSVFSFGVLARVNRIYGGHVTSFSPASLIVDSSDGSNSWDLNAEMYRGNTLTDIEFNGATAVKLGNIADITPSVASFESDRLSIDNNNMHFVTGVGSPEGNIDAPKGSIFTNQAASSVSTLLYVKTTNEGILTGWVAK